MLFRTSIGEVTKASCEAAFASAVFKNRRYEPVREVAASRCEDRTRPDSWVANAETEDGGRRTKRPLFWVGFVLGPGIVDERFESVPGDLLRQSFGRVLGPHVAAGGRLRHEL